MDPDEMNLSSVYRYCSPYCGFYQKDINGDGSEEYSPGHCYLTIYKPLPGHGEPTITSIDLSNVNAFLSTPCLCLLSSIPKATPVSAGILRYRKFPDSLEVENALEAEPIPLQGDAEREVFLPEAIAATQLIFPFMD